MIVNLSPRDWDRLRRAIRLVEGVVRPEHGVRAEVGPPSAVNLNFVQVTSSTKTGGPGSSTYQAAHWFSFDPVTSDFTQQAACWAYEVNGGTLDPAVLYPADQRGDAGDGKLVWLVKGVAGTIAGDTIIPSGSTLTLASGSTLTLASGSTFVLAGPTTSVTADTTVTVATGVTLTFAASGTGAVVVSAPVTLSSTDVKLATTSAGVVTIGGGATASKLRIMEPSGSGSNYTEFVTQAQSANVTYTLPAGPPASNGYALTSTTGGTLSWTNISSGSVAGSDTQVQFNNSSAFGGATGLTYNPSTQITTSQGFVAQALSGGNCLVLQPPISGGATNTLLILDDASGATRVLIPAAANYMQFFAGFDIVTDTSTGTKIGTGSTQKLGFWGATPVAQYNTTGVAVGFTAGAGATVQADATFTGNTGSNAYTIGDIVRALKAAGIMTA